MKDPVLEKAKQLAAWAKANGKKAGAEVTFTSGKRPDSLSEVIKTEEQAKVFMTLLKSY